VAVSVLELVNVQEAGKWAVNGQLAEASRRLEKHVPESQDHGHNSKEGDLDPGLCSHPNLVLMVKQPDA
jgi:hypothetical protein